MRLSERKLRQVIRTEIRNQLNEHTDTPEFRKAMSAIEKAIREAEKFGKHADTDEVRDQALYDDETGYKFEQKLRELYNAFIYGNRRAGRDDEIFK